MDEAQQDQMAVAWLDELPDAYLDEVVTPWHFEEHQDQAAHARMVVGLDSSGQRCFFHHTHTVTEDRFDIDEFPEVVAVLRERRIAWRLQGGQWLTVVDRLDRLESCRPRLTREGPQLVARP